MYFLILSAGYGLRMRPITRLYPKPLLPILNKPLLLYHCLRFYKLGFHNLYINRSYLMELFPEPEFFQEECGVTVTYSDEPEFPYGTGGAISHLIQTYGVDDVVCVNSDSFFLDPCHTFFATIDRKRFDVILLVHPLRRSDGHRYTVFWYNKTTGDLFKEQTEGTIPVFYTGMAWFHRDVVERFPAHVPMDWYRDVLEPGWQKTFRIGGVLISGPWWDLGSSEHFFDVYGGILRSWKNQPEQWAVWADWLKRSGDWYSENIWCHTSARITGRIQTTSWVVIGEEAEVYGECKLDETLLDASTSIRDVTFNQVFIGHDVTIAGVSFEKMLLMYEKQGIMTYPL